MHIDFSSAIDNALLLAAREAARRHAGHQGAVPSQSGHWNSLPKGGRPSTRGRLSPSSGTKTHPVSHAH